MLVQFLMICFVTVIIFLGMYFSVTFGVNKERKESIFTVIVTGFISFTLLYFTFN